MGRVYADNATSSLRVAVGPSDTIIEVGDGGAFPTLSAGQHFMATLTQADAETSWEIVKVTAITDDTLTVERAQEGTTAQSWAWGSKIEIRLTKAGLDAKLESGGVFNIPSGAWTLEDGVPKSVFELTLPANGYAGCIVQYAVEAYTDTDFQVKSGQINLAAVSKSGVQTTDIKDEYVTTQAEAKSGGTLSVVWGVTGGSGKITITCTVDSSLSTPTIKLRGLVFNHSSQTVTLL